MGLIDLVLFYVITGFSLQWIAVAAAAGPQSLIIWPCAFVCFYLPLAFSVLELSSRYPEDGGLYIWTREAFGEFAGFITGWSYWFSNLPYFANVLYFGGSSALFMLVSRPQDLAASPAYFVSFSLGALALITAVNLVGLNVGKVVHNLGAVGMWLATIILIALGLASWFRYGSATTVSATALRPTFRLQDMAFWSSMAFAFCGTEAASFMGQEIKEPRRTIPRALLISGTTIVCCYFMGTITTLAALPPEKLSNLAGPMSAITQTATRLHWDWLIPIAAAAIAIGQLGAAGSFLAACARIPFAIGVDRRLPPVFARLHPRWKTPYVALITQSLLAAILILVSQLGTSVRTAYSILISMTIIANFIPYLFLFAALVRSQSIPTTAIRVPGGAPVALLLATVGFVTTLGAIGLAFVPIPGELNPSLAIAKTFGATVCMLAVGWLIYVAPGRTARPTESAAG